MMLLGGNAPKKIATLIISGMGEKASKSGESYVGNHEISPCETEKMDSSNAIQMAGKAVMSALNDGDTARFCDAMETLVDQCIKARDKVGKDEEQAEVKKEDYMMKREY